MRAQVDSPTYAANYFDPRGAQDLHFPLPEVPYLKLAAVHDQAAGMLTLFALNRSLTEEMPLRVTTAGFSRLVADQALQLHDADLEAVNTSSSPDRVRPSALSGVRVQDGDVSTALRPASWNVIRIKIS